MDWKSASSLNSSELFLELGYATINKNIKDIYLVF